MKQCEAPVSTEVVAELPLILPPNTIEQEDFPRFRTLDVDFSGSDSSIQKEYPELRGP